MRAGEVMRKKCIQNRKTIWIYIHVKRINQLYHSFIYIIFIFVVPLYPLLLVLYKIMSRYLRDTSMPMKHAAFAGKARTIAGPKPL